MAEGFQVDFESQGEQRLEFFLSLFQLMRSCLSFSKCTVSFLVESELAQCILVYGKLQLVLHRPKGGKYLVLFEIFQGIRVKY